jgi:RNA polymerase sigma-70 factor (ECF subfamily)
MSQDGNRIDLPGSGAPDSTSSSLLKRAKSREPGAWERLVEVYTCLIYRWCRLAGLQSVDAADVAQEVLKTVAARFEEFRHDRANDSFRGWLRAITRNKLGDYFRGLKREARAKGGTDAQMQLQEVPEAPEPPSALDLAAEETLLLRSALQVLRSEFEQRTWQAFWRITVDGQSPDCVARELGMTLLAVYKAKSRILCRLRQEVEDPSP